MALAQLPRLIKAPSIRIHLGGRKRDNHCLETGEFAEVEFEFLCQTSPKLHQKNERL